MVETPTPDPTSPPGLSAETLAVAALCAGAIAGPLALGGTLPWSCFGLEMCMAVAVALWALSAPRPAMALVLPIAVACAVLAQLLPIPDRVLTMIAPVSAGAWKVVQTGMPEAWGRISLTPAASAAAARRLLLAVGVVMAVASMARKARLRRSLYTALACSGLSIWAVSFLFPIDRNAPAVYGLFSLRGSIEYWKTSDRSPMQTGGYAFLDWVDVGSSRYQADGALLGGGYGPYIYSNHFANALCLTLPFIFGLAIIYLRKRLPMPLLVGGVIAVTAAAAWSVGVGAASRAGVVSLLFGTTVYISLVARTRAIRWALGACATAFLAVIVAFVAVFQGPLQGILRLLPADYAPMTAAWLADARMVAARTAGRMFLASPVLGTGLGSYGDLFPRFTGSDRVMYFAHNDFAQLLAEAGSVGALAIGGLICWLMATFLSWRRTRPPENRVVDAATWSALAAGMAHSVFDWNMHVPANAFLACLVLGLALSSTGSSRAQATAGPWQWPQRLLAAALAAGCVLSVVFLGRDAIIEHKLDGLRHAITAARLHAADPDTHPAATPALTEAFERGVQGMRYVSGDWRLPVLLGQSLLHRANERGKHDRSADPNPDDYGAWFHKALLASPAARGLPQGPGRP